MDVEIEAHKNEAQTIEAQKEAVMTAENQPTPDPLELPRSDPRRHTIKTRERLDGLASHLREDVEKVDDPRAKALFETTAEVLLGLSKAFADYEAGDEPAWR